jgi:hypothetical protein
MPCTLAARHASSMALASAVVVLGVALSCLALSARAAETPVKADKDTTVTIRAFPPTIHVDATTQTSKDESAGTDSSSEADSGTGKKRGRARITIDGDDDFDVPGGSWNFAHKNPWIIALVFLIVGSIFLTPVILLVGIIWYKLRKTRLQNEAMLRLAERGVVSPAQAADALSTGASPASVAPQVYQQAVALRRRVMWSDLRKGIILSMIGAAFCLYWIVAGSEASWVGLILLFIGIGYISLWWLEGRHLDHAGARTGNGTPGAGGGGESSSGVPGSSGP